MRPISPVMPGSKPIELVFGKDQPEYEDLPAIWLDTISCPVVTRWRLTDEERFAISAGADIIVQQMTFRMLLQPINLQVVMPNECPKLLE